MRRLLGAVLFLLPCVLHGQQFVFIHYTPEDGLAQSQVRCMAQDAQGYLWFGTLGGASRTDGHDFTNYSLQEGLPDPQVNALCTTDDGRVWMGAGASLVMHDGRDLRVVDAGVASGGSRIQALVIDASGDLIIGTDGRGVLRRRGGVIAQLPGFPVDTVNGIRTLLALPDGTLLIGSRNGLFRWKEDRTQLVVMGDDRPKSISALALGKDGSWWVGTFGDGLYRIAPDGRQRNYTEFDGLLQSNIRHVLADDGGRIWISSKFGVNLISDPDGSGRIRAYTVRQGMPNDNIWCAQQDRDGHIWFGTDGAGALRYAGDRFVTFTVKDGLCSDQVMSFTTDGQGDLWLGTYGSGICRNDGMAMISTFDGLPNNTVWCGLHDDQDRLWFGTSDGLCRLERGLVVIPEGEAALVGQRVLSLLQSRDGTIWCGTRDGVTEIHRDGSVLEHMAGAGGPGRSVRSMMEDARGRIWMATDQGVHVHHNGTFTAIGMKDGLSDNTVFCLLLDSRDRIWAGTANGLSCLIDGRPTALRIAPDFGSNYVDLLVEDGDGAVWAGTNNGIYRFMPEEFLQDQNARERFGISDGLLSVECNQNAVNIDRFGRIRFGTSGGVVMYDPRRQGPAITPHAPNVILKGLRSFLQPTDWRNKCDSLSERSGLPVGLRVPFRRNYLTFDYTAIGLADADRLRFRYMLEGLDQEWLPITKDRAASYNNLPQGEYTFKVMAAGRNGIWSEPESFSFTVLKPWWLTYWFFGLCVLVLGGGAWAIHRYRSTVRLRHEKTRQLMLRSRMLQLEQQTLNANMNRHFIFNALNSIQYYINRQDRSTANRYLTSFAKLIRKNLDASQSDTTTLAEELERLELYLVLEHMRFKDRFRYELSVDPIVDTSQVRLPAMMLQPYVENSIWHGILPMEEQGLVKISVLPLNEDRVRVHIVDDGIGVDESRSRKQPTASDHISRGIEITKGRTDVLRKLQLTDIRIEGPEQIQHNGKPAGTQVTIDLPYKAGVEGIQQPDLHSDASVTTFGTT